MPDLIDWNFIAPLEGDLVLQGYVPDAANSRSGVTIATGFDIGQRNPTDLDNLFGAGSTLSALFAPYTGMEGQAAETFLASNPLVITQAQALKVNKTVKSGIVSALHTKYDSAITQLNANARSAAQKSGTTAPALLSTFLMLPKEAQTVIASVEFQYGDLKTATPNFWKQVTGQLWQEAYDNLRNFGDRYPTRRRKEAAYLLPIVTRGHQRLNLRSPLPTRRPPNFSQRYPQPTPNPRYLP